MKSIKAREFWGSCRISWMMPSIALVSAISSSASFEMVGARPSAGDDAAPKGVECHDFVVARSCPSCALTLQPRGLVVCQHKNLFGGIAPFRTRWATLPMTLVLPVPAPASTSVTSSSVAIASACPIRHRIRKSRARHSRDNGCDEEAVRSFSRRLWISRRTRKAPADLTPL